MDNQKQQVYSPPLASNGRDQRNTTEARPGIKPDQVILGQSSYKDDALDWQIEHKLNQTSSAQATQLVAVHRQAQLDAFKVSQASEIGGRLAVEMAEKIEKLTQLNDAYIDADPRVSEKVASMVEELQSVYVHLPKAAMALNLRRYGLG